MPENNSPQDSLRGKRIDLTGQIFGWLYLIGRAPKGKSYDTRYFARCFHPKLAPEQGPCGNVSIVYALALKSKKEATKSCGQHGLAGAPPKHGYRTQAKREPEYYTWVSAKQRCFDVNCNHYKYYGGRGITMCEGLQSSFRLFLSVLGLRPTGKLIDRKDNNGHYSCGVCPQCIENGWPMNLHWVTPKESAANRRKRGSC